jgi:hypothetical protein
MPDPELGEIAEQAKNLQEPENYGNQDHDVEDAFDLTLHWYAIYQPEQHAYDA